MSVLPTCIFWNHEHGRCLRRPEEGVRPPGTGGTDDYQPPCGCWELFCVPRRAVCLSSPLCVFLGAGETAQWTRCFLFKREDQSSDPQSLHKSWELWCVEESLQVRGQPQPQEQEDGRCLGPAGLTSQMTSSRFSNCRQKLRWKSHWGKDIPVSTTCTYLDKYVFTYKCTCYIQQRLYKA